ncbi:MAG: hypothetical protein E7676_01555 [Ruminococcaceae bacterium]|nr:hypothetical protein [Oscillospiraceae bacterium]
MKDINTQKDERLEHFSSLLEAARLAAGDRDERLDKNMNQYLGGAEIDGSSEPALTVRNITYEIIESEIDPAVPVPKVDAFSYSEERERRAASIERLCTALRDRLPFEDMNDLDERYTYIYGASVWYAEWEQDGGDGGIRLHCLSPKSFLGQPGITKIEDMEYCFLTFITTKDELMRKYGVSEEDSALAEYEYKYDGASLSDTVKVVLCFYRDEDSEVSRFIFSGDLVLEDTPKLYKRKSLVCSSCGAAIGECGCGAPLVLSDLSAEDIKVGSRSVRVPYYTPMGFPIVIRKNSRSEDGVFGSSDCEIIRPQQQAINKVESRILQKLLRAAITPIMPEDSSVTLGNSVFGQVIKMRPGESASSYGKIDTTPDISQDILEADRLYEQAKRVLGISDALQGLDTTSVESGYARQLKISQSASRLETKRRMKNLAYSEIYRLIFEHYLAFADATHELSYKDGLGVVHTEHFSRHDFIEWGDGSAPHYADEYLFSTGEDSESQYKREALWERNLENLESGTLGDKSEPKTLLRYWQAQEKAHYPYAKDNVEYFKGILENQNQKESEKENEKSD